MYPCDVGLGSGFLDRIPKAQVTTEKNTYNLHFIKINTQKIIEDILEFSPPLETTTIDIFAYPFLIFCVCLCDHTILYILFYNMHVYRVGRCYIIMAV